jgi:hypothetical protein
MSHPASQIGPFKRMRQKTLESSPRRVRCDPMSKYRSTPVFRSATSERLVGGGLVAPGAPLDLLRACLHRICCVERPIRREAYQCDARIRGAYLRKHVWIYLFVYDCLSFNQSCDPFCCSENGNVGRNRKSCSWNANNLTKSSPVLGFSRFPSASEVFHGDLVLVLTLWWLEMS